LGRDLTLDRPFEPHPEGGHFVAAVANRVVRAKSRTRRDPAEKIRAAPLGPPSQYSFGLLRALPEFLRDILVSAGAERLTGMFGWVFSSPQN
jgi:hypothetical protein